MRLVIRNQEKTVITNFNHVSDIVISESSDSTWEIIACYPYFAEGDCGYTVLGTYSTEEKAFKVLDEICDFLFRCEGIFEMPHDDKVN